MVTLHGLERAFIFQFRARAASDFEVTRPGTPDSTSKGNITRLAFYRGTGSDTFKILPTTMEKVDMNEEEPRPTTPASDLEMRPARDCTIHAFMTHKDFTTGIPGKLGSVDIDLEPGAVGRDQLVKAIVRIDIAFPKATKKVAPWHAGKNAPWIFLLQHHLQDDKGPSLETWVSIADAYPYISNKFVGANPEAYARFSTSIDLLQYAFAHLKDMEWKWHASWIDLAFSTRKKAQIEAAKDAFLDRWFGKYTPDRHVRFTCNETKKFIDLVGKTTPVDKAFLDIAERRYIDECATFTVRPYRR